MRGLRGGGLAACRSGRTRVASGLRCEPGGGELPWPDPRALMAVFRRLLGNPSQSPSAADEDPAGLEPVSSRSDALLDIGGDCVSEPRTDTLATASPVARTREGASTTPGAAALVSAAASVGPPRPAIVPVQAPEPPSPLPESRAPAAKSSPSGSAPSEGLSARRRTDLAVVRACARENGYTVADRGRIAAAILTAYDRAH